MNEERSALELAGCQPEPLGSYLKALGVLKIVAEQADPGATGAWEGGGFALSTMLDRNELVTFFCEAYRPTGVVSPWNNSSGFGAEGRDGLSVIELAENPRFDPYREAIKVARRLLDQRDQRGWTKDEMVAMCRASLPDASVAWIDASVVLTDGRAVYPPLLGTGGNDGRLEFSRNFHQRLIEVTGLGKADAVRRRSWLGDALFSTGGVARLRGPSPGQFDGGGAGGPNSSPLGAADGLLNPWDWILLVEGSLLFASGAARRLASSNGGRAAAPFTVESSATGYPSAADQEASRGELWLPMWSRPTGLPELRRLFSEARSDWRGRHVRSGLELAKAATTLGVDRGITAFSRHALLERNGLATVAVPIGRVVTGLRRAVIPLAALDDWLDRLRRAKNLPSGVIQGLRAIDDAAFAVTSGLGTSVQVLLAAASLDTSVSYSPNVRERAPLLSLAARDWVPILVEEDQSPEMRLALSLASGRDRSESSGGASSFRALLRARWGKTTPYAPASVLGLGSRWTIQVLADAHARRAVELRRAGFAGAGVESGSGFATRFDTAIPPSLADVARLAGGAVDEERLGLLLRACLLLDFRGAVDIGRATERHLLSPALTLLGPFFTAQPVADGSEGNDWADRLAGAELHAEPSWPALLAAGRAAPVLTAALRRLHIAGLDGVGDGATLARGVDHPAAVRLGAALLCAMTLSARRILLGHCCPEPPVIQGDD